MNIKRNRQRNYRRNKDIVYPTELTNKSGALIEYGFDDTDVPTFTLNTTNGNLYYTQNQHGNQSYSNGVLRINVVPYSFIRIDANGNMELIADVPTLVDDTFFELNQITGELIIHIE